VLRVEFPVPVELMSRRQRYQRRKRLSAGPRSADDIEQRAPAPPFIATSDESGFWIVAGGELIHYHPGRDESPRWTVPLANVSVIASDGDFLWLARWMAIRELPEFDRGIRVFRHRSPAPVDSRVLIWHKPTQRWVGQMRPAGAVTTITPADRRVWIGRFHDRTHLLCVNSANLYRPVGGETRHDDTPPAADPRDAQPSEPDRPGPRRWTAAHAAIQRGRIGPRTRTRTPGSPNSGHRRRSSSPPSSASSKRCGRS